MKKIIVVEDSRLIRQEIVDALKKDFQIYDASDAHEALALITKHRVDWLLLNPFLAKNSGLELLYEVKSWADLRSLKTILLTHETDYFLRHKKALKELSILHVFSLSSLNFKSLSVVLNT